MARFLKILSTILFAILAVTLALMIAVVLLFKQDSSAPSVFGYRFVLVNNEYMGDAVPNGSFVTAKNVTASQNKGDVLLYYADGNTSLQMGRVIEKEIINKTEVYTLKMDKSDAVAKVSQNNVVSVVKGVSTKLGAIVRFATSFRGVFVIALLPCALLILLEIIISVSSHKKKDTEKKDEEPIQTPAKPTVQKTAPKTDLQKVILKKQENSTPKKSHEQKSANDDDIVLVKAGEAAGMFAHAQKQNEPKSQSEKKHIPTADEKNRVVDAILDEVESDEIKLGL